MSQPRNTPSRCFVSPSTYSRLLALIFALCAWLSRSLIFVSLTVPPFTYIPEPFVALLFVMLQSVRFVFLVMYNAPPFTARLLVKLMSVNVTGAFI